MPLKNLERILEALGGQNRMDFTLERFRSVLSQLGDPQNAVPTLVIGGTNGKGSTTLFLSNILSEAGFKVATYLSPHLQSPRERMLFNLSAIDAGELEALALRFEDKAYTANLTYFEFLTLLHFVWAKEKGADINVLEVGLGGRLDATNVTNPLACVVTNIGLDHQSYLGNTKAEILNEKLGIVPAEGLLFSAEKDPELLKQIERACDKIDSIYYFSKELRVSESAVSLSGQSFTVNGYPITIQNPMPAMKENAALAFLLSRIVFPKIQMETIQAGLANTITPGRFELISEAPRVILSGDHNPDGIAALVQTLEATKPTNLKILCGFSADKPYKEMYASLKNISSRVLLTAPSKTANKLAEDYWAMGEHEKNPQYALDLALATMGSQDTLLITGSLYLIGELRNRWQHQVKFSSR